jgi:hypothetical protein
MEGIAQPKALALWYGDGSRSILDLYELETASVEESLATRMGPPFIRDKVGFRYKLEPPWSTSVFKKTKECCSRRY